jgi:hypothetical protein
MIEVQLESEPRVGGAFHVSTEDLQALKPVRVQNMGRLFDDPEQAP